MQNMFSNMTGGGGGQGQNQSGGVRDDTPWWLKYAAKGAGIAGGIIAIFFGVWCCITIYPTCIVAGIWQIAAGFFVIAVEAPFCCMFLDFVQKFSGMVEGRPPWQKAVLYLILSMPAFFLCLNMSTFLGSGSLFVTAVIFGIISIGKKASREEMVANLGGGVPSSSASRNDMKSDLVGNIQGQDVEAAKGNFT